MARSLPGPGKSVAREAWATLVSTAPQGDPLFRDMAMSRDLRRGERITRSGTREEVADRPGIDPSLCSGREIAGIHGSSCLRTDIPNCLPAINRNTSPWWPKTWPPAVRVPLAPRFWRRLPARTLGAIPSSRASSPPARPRDSSASPLPRPALLAKPGDDKTLQAAAAIFDLSGKAPVSYLKTPEHHRLYAMGQTEFNKLCATCHHPEGKGMETLAPPLLDSQWVLGPAKRLTALVMEGLMGPIDVNGTIYDVPKVQPVMPGVRFNPELSDEEIAGILTYIRNSWDNAAPPVDPSVVKAWRESQSLGLPLPLPKRWRSGKLRPHGHKATIPTRSDSAPCRSSGGSARRAKSKCEVCQASGVPLRDS